MAALQTFRIGLISDTHGLLRPQALEALSGVTHIIHAGDIGNADVVARLANIAPLSIIRGNNDTGTWAASIPETLRVQFGTVVLYVVHDVNDLDIDSKMHGIDVVVSGHSHKPVVEMRDGVLFVNPGSAGPRRFKLPVSVGYLDMVDGAVAASLRTLEV